MVAERTELPTELDICEADRDVGTLSIAPLSAVPHLLRLPLELRQQIYASTFGHATVHIPLDRNMVIMKDWHMCKPYTTRGKRDFLCLNRQIHAEASDVLWQLTKVVVTIYTASEIKRRFLRCQSQDLRSRSYLLDRMQHVVLCILIPSQCNDNSGIDEPLSKFKAMLDLRSPLATLRLHFFRHEILENLPVRLEEAYAAFRRVNALRVIACGSWKVDDPSDWTVRGRLTYWHTSHTEILRGVLSSVEESPEFEDLLASHEATNDNDRLDAAVAEIVTAPGALYRPDDIFLYDSITRAMRVETPERIISL